MKFMNFFFVAMFKNSSLQGKNLNCQTLKSYDKATISLLPSELSVKSGDFHGESLEKYLVVGHFPARRATTSGGIVLHINCHPSWQCFHIVGTDFQAPNSDAGDTSGHQAASVVRNWGAKRRSWKENLVSKIIYAEVSSFVCYCWWRIKSTRCETWDVQSQSSVMHIVYCSLENQKWNTGSACWPDGSSLTHEILFKGSPLFWFSAALCSTLLAQDPIPW